MPHTHASQYDPGTPPPKFEPAAGPGIEASAVVNEPEPTHEDRVAHIAGLLEQGLAKGKTDA